MCCNTKEKIALAVKELMRQKSIRKITVQDIMEETGMKRQSFYYHFQDLYAVIEWICCKELMEEVDVDGDITFEEWLRKLMETMEDRVEADGRPDKSNCCRAGRQIPVSFR